MSTEKCKMAYSDPHGPHDVAVPAANVDESTETLQIEALAAGGRGVARREGQVWFVSGALPGDRVLAEVVRRHKSYVEGRLIRRLQDSPARRLSPCPLQPECGGCPWMPLGETEQRRWKRSLVRDALRRIGQTEVEVDEVRTSPVLAYRNKVEFTLGRDPAGRPVVGLHSGRSEGALVDIDRCAVQHDAANAVLASARTYLLDHAEEWVDSLPGRAEPYRLVIRRSWLTGEILVALRETTRPFPAARGLAEHLAQSHDNLAGVVRIEARRGRRGGTRISRVLGRTWLEERIGETTFRLPAASFFQINTYAASELLDVVVECVGRVEGRRIADLYAGVGAFGIELARRGANVTLCEADGQAVLCGRRAARAGDSKKIAFARAEVSDFLRRTRRDGCRFDVIVANPPRSGMGNEVPRLIGEHRPERIVLVSCDPATLARDTRRLMRQGYLPERVIPIDLFPQTAHVETVLVLRQGAAGYGGE